MSEERVYTLAEFADSVRLSQDQVWKHIRGELKPSLNPGRSGRKPLFRESVRATFLDELPKYHEADEVSS
jgi:hypothetical protein